YGHCPPPRHAVQPTATTVRPNYDHRGRSLVAVGRYSAPNSTKRGTDGRHRSPRPHPAPHLPPLALAGGTELAGSAAASRWRTTQGLRGSGPAHGLPPPAAG